MVRAATDSRGYRCIKNIMHYYPAYLDLNGRDVLVVGGGTIAEGKIQQLIAAKAVVHVVSPDLTPHLSDLVASEAIKYEQREFRAADLNDKFLVISATDQQPVNEAVAKLAVERRMLCNVVDQAALCNFITPAIVSRGDLQISISTGGSSPSVAQRVKREIGELIGPQYGELIELAKELRIEVRKNFSTFEERRDLLRAFAESEALDLLRAGKREEARRIGQDLLERAIKEKKQERI